MSVLPQTRAKRLEFFEARVGQWTDNAAAIGISAAQAASIKSRTMDDREAYTNAQMARDAAKAATLTWYTSNDSMVNLGRDLIRTIKAYAETTNNPNVYALANIDPPAPPQPVPAPETPTAVVGSVSPDGIVTLKWRATRSGSSSGIFFVVERKRGEGEYQVVSAVVEKMFMDPQANVTQSQVQYRIKAVRGEEMSEYTTPVVFNFVSGGGGAGRFVVSGGDAGGTAEYKMAA